ncbi:dihydrofolate reductase family protein [Brachybacterium hainanense]|uniref:Dihydrofolate reductase family protein n=1 Tax=Brachybacterium hainanense TaxID=1541174 RepID=A0ABV6R795_9MICO
MTAYRFYTATSLDGFIATPDDDLGWLLSQPIDQDGPMSYAEFIAGIGAIVMGSSTYAWILEHGTSGTEEGGDGWDYEQPAFVLSHRALEPAAASVRIVSGPVEALRGQLEEAAGDGDVWIVGGGDLAAQFARAGMLDEIIVSIAPVTLGAGKPLFTGAFDLDLVEHARNRAFLCARYRVLGPRQ